MARKVPCQYCKRRRRKCERLNESEPCTRCRHMGKKCIPQDFETSSFSSSDDFDFNAEGINEEHYNFMQQQVEMLEREIKHLEIAIADQKALTRKEPRWDFTVTDGEVRLHSEIKTFEEFLLYRESAVRYLSPFSGTFHRNSLVFERVQPSLLKKFANFATRLRGVSRNSTDQHSGSSLVSRNYLNGTAQFVHTAPIVDALVENFFKCANGVFPLVHEPTFRQYYRNSKKDPLKEPLIAGMCCAAAMNTCEHSLFNQLEKRYISEYFYNIAISQLIDIFDDPDHALEALVTINLLYRFMGLTLRIDEIRKWSAIATMIGNSLKREMEPYQAVKNEHPKLQIKSAITQRNSIVAEGVMSILEFVAFNSQEPLKRINVTLEILPDETGLVRDFLETMNHVLELIRNPIILKIVSQTRNLIVGSEAEFSFEELMRYEEILLEWWHDLPDSLKLTKEPFNCTRDIIAKCTDIKKLLTCCYIHVLNLGMQSCLVNPKLKGTNESITNVVRERAAGLVINAAEITLIAAKQITLVPNLCMTPITHLVRILDSLIMIIDSHDKKVAAAARAMLKKCMAEIDEMISPEHHVSSIISPIYANSRAPDSVTTPDTDLYLKYPIPAAALVYDVLQNSVDKL